MRTLRFLLAAGLLAAVSSAGGCGSRDSSAPAVEPGKPAGDVRSLAGAVTARRGTDAPRTLKVGDEVSGDDVIATAADASVVIELRHNGVRWSLGPGQEKQVSTAAAWQAPRGGGGSIDDRSTAAGRHAEREAAETAETAVATSESAPAPAATPTAPPPPPVQAAAIVHDDPIPAATPPPPPKPAAPQRKQVADDDMPAPMAPPSKTARGDGSIAAPESASEKDDEAKPFVGVVDVAFGTSAGPLDEVAVMKIVKSRKGAMAACWQRVVDGGLATPFELTMTFTVAADGRVSSTHASESIEGDVSSCIERVVSRLRFETHDAPSDVSVSLALTIK